MTGYFPLHESAIVLLVGSVSEELMLNRLDNAGSASRKAPMKPDNPVRFVCRRTCFKSAHP